MIREDELMAAIAECQGVRNPNANTCAKLASFYIILDHIKGNRAEPGYESGYSFGKESSVADAGYVSGSEFGVILATKDPYAVLKTVDELMETLRVMQPRLYDAFMRKLTALD